MDSFHLYQFIKHDVHRHDSRGNPIFVSERVRFCGREYGFAPNHGNDNSGSIIVYQHNKYSTDYRVYFGYGTDEEGSFRYDFDHHDIEENKHQYLPDFLLLKIAP